MDSPFTLALEPELAIKFIIADAKSISQVESEFVQKVDKLNETINGLIGKLHVLLCFLIDSTCLIDYRVLQLQSTY